MLPLEVPIHTCLFFFKSDKDDCFKCLLLVTSWLWNISCRIFFSAQCWKLHSAIWGSTLYGVSTKTRSPPASCSHNKARFHCKVWSFHHQADQKKKNWGWNKCCHYSNEPLRWKSRIQLFQVYIFSLAFLATNDSDSDIFSQYRYECYTFTLPYSLKTRTTELKLINLFVN